MEEDPYIFKVEPLPLVKILGPSGWLKCVLFFLHINRLKFREIQGKLLKSKGKCANCFESKWKTNKLDGMQKIRNMVAWVGTYIKWRPWLTPSTNSFALLVRIIFSISGHIQSFWPHLAGNVSNVMLESWYSDAFGLKIAILEHLECFKYCFGL